MWAGGRREAGVVSCRAAGARAKCWGLVVCVSSSDVVFVSSSRVSRMGRMLAEGRMVENRGAKDVGWPSLTRWLYTPNDVESPPHGTCRCVRSTADQLSPGDGAGRGAATSRDTGGGDRQYAESLEFAIVLEGAETQSVVRSTANPGPELWTVLECCGRNTDNRHNEGECWSRLPHVVSRGIGVLVGARSDVNRRAESPKPSPRMLAVSGARVSYY